MREIVCILASLTGSWNCFLLIWRDKLCKTGTNQGFCEGETTLPRMPGSAYNLLLKQISPLWLPRLEMTSLCHRTGNSFLASSARLRLVTCEKRRPGIRAASLTKTTLGLNMWRKIFKVSSSFGRGWQQPEPESFFSRWWWWCVSSHTIGGLTSQGFWLTLWGVHESAISLAPTQDKVDSC